MANEFDEEAIRRVLFPYASAKLDEIKEKNTRFSHYTSAEAAISIIRNNEVWMRSAEVMNDFSEIQYGQDCISYAWNQTSLGERLRAILNRRQDGLADQLKESLNARQFERSTQSYLISISEHGNGTGFEDEFGRLSMWRAYGGDTNVAFVFNNTPFVTDSNAINAFTSPVLYCTQENFAEDFKTVVQNLEKNFELVSMLEPNELHDRVFNAFHFAVLSTKHPGFSEEREWRVVHSPTLWPSEKLESDVHVINGVPQKIYKLKLTNYPEEGFVGATLPELLEEVVIGPTMYPFPIYDALVHELTVAGVEAAREKVRVSQIPLRK